LEQSLIKRQTMASFSEKPSSAKIFDEHDIIDFKAQLVEPEAAADEDD